MSTIPLKNDNIKREQQISVKISNSQNPNLKELKVKKLDPEEINYYSFIKFLAAILVVRQHTEFDFPKISLSIIFSKVLTVFGNAKLPFFDSLWNFNFGFLATGTNQSGTLGVVLFFVFSSFLITKNFLSGKYKLTFSGILHFYFNRLKRIVPLYYFLVVFGLFFVFFEILQNNNWLGILGLFLFNYNYKMNFNYAYWTVGTEILFYFFCPIIIIISLFLVKILTKFLILVSTLISIFKINKLSKNKLIVSKFQKLKSNNFNATNFTQSNNSKNKIKSCQLQFELIEPKSKFFDISKIRFWNFGRETNLDFLEKKIWSFAFLGIIFCFYGIFYILTTQFYFRSLIDSKFLKNLHNLRSLVEWMGVFLSGMGLAFWTRFIFLQLSKWTENPVFVNLTTVNCSQKFVKLENQKKPILSKEIYLIKSLNSELNSKKNFNFIDLNDEKQKIMPKIILVQPAFQKTQNIVSIKTWQTLIYNFYSKKYSNFNQKNQNLIAKIYLESRKTNKNIKEQKLFQPIKSLVKRQKIQNWLQIIKKCQKIAFLFVFLSLVLPFNSWKIEPFISQIVVILTMTFFILTVELREILGNLLKNNFQNFEKSSENIKLKIENLNEKLLSKIPTNNFKISLGMKNNLKYNQNLQSLNLKTAFGELLVNQKNKNLEKKTSIFDKKIQNENTEKQKLEKLEKQNWKKFNLEKSWQFLIAGINETSKTGYGIFLVHVFILVRFNTIYRESWENSLGKIKAGIFIWVIVSILSILTSIFLSKSVEKPSNIWLGKMFQKVTNYLKI